MTTDLGFPSSEARAVPPLETDMLPSDGRLTAPRRPKNEILLPSYGRNWACDASNTCIAACCEVIFLSDDPRRWIGQQIPHEQKCEDTLL